MDLYCLIRKEMMITIIGAAHILALREKVRDKIKQIGPQTVCLELDPKRYKSLLRDDV